MINFKQKIFLFREKNSRKCGSLKIFLKFIYKTYKARELFSNISRLIKQKGK